MVQLVPIVAVVMSACSVFGSLSHVPGQDQYKTRGVEDEQQHQPHQQLRFGKATDYQFPNVHLQHRFGPFLKKMTQKSQSIVPELQVGCGEGFTEPRKKFKGRRKRAADGKGNFYYTPPLRSYSVYKPQAYQIQKPYYIPVWGAPGRVPLYFPPQPLLLNPGFPKDNPRKSYLPPQGYLPPAKPTKPTIEDRFMDRDDDAPIWDTESLEPLTPSTTQAIPTRRTRRPGQRTTFPPLVHNEVTRNDTFINLAVAASPLETATTTTTTTTVPPLPETGPSRCVWAIISCCGVSSAAVSYNCFEQLGCNGAFWDNSPCDSAFARAAIDSAMKYYANTR